MDQSVHEPLERERRLSHGETKPQLQPRCTERWRPSWRRPARSPGAPSQAAAQTQGRRQGQGQRREGQALRGLQPATFVCSEVVWNAGGGAASGLRSSSASLWKPTLEPFADCPPAGSGRKLFGSLISGQGCAISQPPCVRSSCGATHVPETIAASCLPYEPNPSLSSCSPAGLSRSPLAEPNLDLSSCSPSGLSPTQPLHHDRLDPGPPCDSVSPQANFSEPCAFEFSSSPSPLRRVLVCSLSLGGLSKVLSKQAGLKPPGPTPLPEPELLRPLRRLCGVSSLRLWAEPTVLCQRFSIPCGCYPAQSWGFLPLRRIARPGASGRCLSRILRSCRWVQVPSVVLNVSALTLWCSFLIGST